MARAGAKELKRNLLSRAAGIALGAVCAAVAAHAAEFKAWLDIPAQSLEAALKEFGVETNSQVLFAKDIVAGRTSAQVKGVHTPSEALRLLLATTNLRFEQSADKVFLVKVAAAPDAQQNGAANQPPPPAPQAAQGPGAAAADEPSDERSDTKAGEGAVEKVTVTGSRIRGRRTDGPSPVITFDRKKFDEIGAVSVPDVLRHLPQTSSNLPDQAGQTGPAGALTVALRGLPDSSTLVLIDGRRAQVAPDALGGANLNGIPLSAVERIEVLTDGASAIYGADAAAGVVNIILRRNYEGAEVGARYGNTLRSDSGETVGTAAFGTKFGQLSLLVTGELIDRNDMYLSDLRQPFRTQNFLTLGGLDRRVTSAATPGTIFALSGNLPGVGAPRAILPAGQNGVGLTTASFLPTAGQQNLASTASLSNVVAGAERQHAFVRLNYEFDDGVTAFANFLYSDDTQLRKRSLFQVNSATIPAANPFNPFGVNVRFSGAIVHDDLPEYAYDIENTKAAFSGLAGVSKDFGNGWDVEVAAGYQKDDSRAFSYTLNTSRLQTHLNTVTTPSGALNLFATIPSNAPGTVFSFLDQTIFKYDRETKFADAKVRGELLALAGGPVQAVLGGETFHHVFSSSVQSIGDAKRTTWAVFGELDVPIVSEANASPLIRELTLNVAGRYDHYSDFGESTNPKVSVIYRPAESVFVRGSWGTFFRAPTMPETYQPLVLSSFAVLVTDPRRGNVLTTAALAAGGNVNLVPEDGAVWNVGFGWRFKEWADLVTTIDYWNLDQENVNGRIGSQLLVNFEALFPQFVHRAPPGPADILLGQPGPITVVDSVPVNFGSRKTDGVDFQVQYGVTTDVGRFSTSILGTRTLSYDEALVPGTPPGERVGRANIGSALYPPKWKGVATVAWGNEGWAASLTGRYVGSVIDFNSVTNAILAKIDATWTFDASLSYGFHEPDSWMDGVTIRIGGQNIFDRPPDFFLSSPIGVLPQRDELRGRVLYIDVSKKF